MKIDESKPKIKIRSALIFVGMNMIEGMVGFSFHFLSLEFVVLINAFAHILDSSGFGPFLENDGFALCFHLLCKEFVLLLLKLIMELLFTSLFFLFFEDLSFLVVIHAFPVVWFNAVSVEFGLAGFLL
jgi:hypothetical protein